MTAQNLLYIEAKDSMLAASKGTTEYENIMKRLMELNYKHQEQAADESKFNPEDAKLDTNNQLIL
jgi:hypothetical protein